MIYISLNESAVFNFIQMEGETYCSYYLEYYVNIATHRKTNKHKYNIEVGKVAQWRRFNWFEGKEKSK